MTTFAGGKFSGSHTTAIEAADPVLRVLTTRPEVSKIILGRIQAGRTCGVVSLKTADIDAGLRCTIRSNTGVQEFFVYTSDRHATAAAMHAVMPQKRGKCRKKLRDMTPENFVDPFAGRRRKAV